MTGRLAVGDAGNLGTCALCTGGCAGVDLAPLLNPQLAWLWRQLAAAADRRGDPDLMTGPAVTVHVPADAGQRAAAAGLLGTRPLAARQKRRVELAELTAVLAARSPRLSPGAVAAHAAGQRLAEQARQRSERQVSVDRATARLLDVAPTLPGHVRARIGELDELTARLRKAGWFTRLLREPDPDALLDLVVEVAARLPEQGRRVDRRTLLPSDPHALDGGSLPSLVLTLVRERVRGRDGWANIGVGCDELLGGLIVTGVLPEGWNVPAGVTVTIPPRELSGVRWQQCPAGGSWVFVTENPSVLTAAVALPVGGAASPPRVVCTAGTPSNLECDAIRALTATGWQVAVRADFDAAGLAHVSAILEKATDARPWRMNATDFLELARPGAEGDGDSDVGELGIAAQLSSPWDPQLAAAMAGREPVFEEELLPQLLRDIAAGQPGLTATGEEGFRHDGRP